MNIDNDLKIELIPILISILETKSVTQTARSLGVTQSAISHSLKKLRHQFGDQLVVREGNTLIPTVAAQRMLPRLKQWLGDLNQIVAGGEFDPKKSRRTFFIATTDVFEQIYLPRIVACLSTEGPELSVRILRWNHKTIYRQLLEGDVDLAIGVRNLDYPNLLKKSLYTDGFVSAVCNEHPLAKKRRISLEQFLSYPHVMTDSEGTGVGVVDRALEKFNRTRRVKHTVSNFASAPYLLQDNEAILTSPNRFLRFCAQYQSISLFKPPVDLDNFTVKAFWSRRNHEDPANVWLRKLLYKITPKE